VVKRSEGKEGGNVTEKKQLLDAIVSSSETPKTAKCEDEYDFWMFCSCYHSTSNATTAGIRQS